MRTDRDRDPLTLRIAREVRETEMDRYSWWEAPQHVARPRPYRHSLRTRLVTWLREIFTSTQGLT